MNETRTLIFIGAHPDDESFGLGGTLAFYAQQGVRVYYVCATRGEAGTIDPEMMKGYTDPGDLRWAELKCAAQILGLKDLIYLGYRDSGMPGAPENKHPNALVNAPMNEVVEKIVKVIRELHPEVVITFDPIGGYRHPDHIAIHNAAVKAFSAAADPSQYPKTGPAFQPSKLYFGVFPHRLMRFAVKVMPLFGQNPHQFGRNKDIDLTQMVAVEYPVHAAVHLTKQAIEVSDKAADCHASQLAGGTPERGLLGLIFHLSEFFCGLFGEKDYYMRAYPEPKGRKREKDLFEGVI
jgi:N-acetyl-1-D-myo-inositol-2-amino-2-deoxy-alpha-D-glucopyranoside deacetylase/mycothiol S-conjugate amidase